MVGAVSQSVRWVPRHIALMGVLCFFFFHGGCCITEYWWVCVPLAWQWPLSFARASQFGLRDGVLVDLRHSLLKPEHIWCQVRFEVRVRRAVVAALAFIISCLVRGTFQ